MRRQWEENEITILKKMVHMHFPMQLPPEILKNLSNSFGRSWLSINSKFQKIKKQLEFEKNQSSKVDHVSLREMITNALI